MKINVAYPLLRAVSPLMATPLDGAEFRISAGVETSLDAARKSAYATSEKS